MDPKIVKAGTLKSLKFTPEAHRGPSGTSDDSKMRSRGHSSSPKWPHRAVLAPLGGPKNTILEHLWLSESVSDPHFAVKRSLKNRREFCLCKMCDFQVSWRQSTRKSRCGPKKTASILSLQTSYSSKDMATEYLRKTCDRKKLARAPFRFREHRLHQIARSLTP